jgi:ATP/ADP translocase
VFDILRIWPRVLYYIFCEIYAVTVMMIWIWQVINRYVAKEERVRFISSMLIAAQISALNTGLVTKELGKICGSLNSMSKAINLIILGLTILMFFANRYLAKNVALPEIEGERKKESNSQEKSADIWSIIKKNPVYILAALLTVYYGLTTVWVEQFWKDKMKTLAEMKAAETGISKGIAYNQLNSIYFIFQSRLAIIVALVISNFANKLPWLVAATITPLTLLIGSFLVFGSVVFPDITGSIFHGMGALQVSYWGGFFVLASFKGGKYVLFDRSKEDYVSSKSVEARREIKNLEGLLGRVGKSGAAICSYALIVAFNWNFNSISMSKFLFVACSIISITWIVSDFFLNRDLNRSKKSE